jgi:hypothetical protein
MLIMSTEQNQFTVYSNNLEVMATLFDFTMRFEFIGQAGKTELGNVTVSPQHMKAIVQLLNNNLFEYEKKFGEIVLPNVEINSTSVNK